MTRLARRVSLLIALSLLTSAATVHAQVTEGAKWVLWKADAARQNWQPASTWDTAKDCRDHRPRFRIEGTVLLVDGLVPGWCCLPDILYPRSARATMDTISAKDKLSSQDI